MTSEPHPSRENVRSGVLAFLFTDIEGSMRRWETWPQAMRVALGRHDKALREAIAAHDGQVFKTVGDAFCAAFGSPAEAIRAALDALRALAGEDFEAVGGLPVRMAIHAGPVETRDGDYFGQGVNRVARLLAVAHGGQALVSESAADMSQAELRAEAELIDLGVHRLRDVAEPKRIFQLAAPGLRFSFPPPRAEGAKPHNLPRQITSFVRRDVEIEAVKSRLAAGRLVTLVGSGGAGKTRTAIEVGWDLLATTYQSVWFLELATIEDGALVAEALCAALAAPSVSNAPAIERAVAHLRNANALLVIDNCEHLIDAVAGLAGDLLGRCPAIAILCTSREALEIPGENAYRVSSLAAPPSERALTAEAASGFDAVRLFVERAAAAVPGFRLTNANAAAIGSICRRLDGIPMAIELVAPQLRMLQPAALDARLKDKFLLAMRGGRAGLPRHQTLTTVFDWSHNLLSDIERAVFRRLSVFADGWTFDAAVAVATGDGVAADDVFACLSALVAKSLAVADLSGASSRYRYLETTRQYAAERLRESRDTDLPKRFARSMIAIFEASHEAWPTVPTESWLETYEPELDNLRAALEWAFGAEGNAALGVALTSQSLRIFDELSLLAERERWFTLAQQRIEPTTPPAVRARIWLGRTSNSAHGDRTNFELAELAAKAFEQAEDRIGLAEALAKAGAALETPDAPEPGLPYLQRAIATLRPLGATKLLASCLRSLAVAQYFRRDFGAARALVAESAATARRVGDGRGIVQAEIAAAELEFATGAVEAAIAVARGTLAGSQYNRRQLTLTLGNLAAYLLAADRVMEARAAALESLDVARALRWRPAVARAIEHLALVAALRGRLEPAAVLAGFAVAFYAEGAATREYSELSTFDRLNAALDAGLGADAADSARRRGADMDEDVIADLAGQA